MFIIIRKNKESEYIIHTSVCIMYQLCHFQFKNALTHIFCILYYCHFQFESH